MHPPRIAGFSYQGEHRYLLTFTTFRRSPHFCTPDIVAHVVAEFLRCASIEEFEIIAYCFMPDHVHLLVAGRSVTASRYGRD